MKNFIPISCLGDEWMAGPAPRPPEQTGQSPRAAANTSSKVKCWASVGLALKEEEFTRN